MPNKQYPIHQSSLKVKANYIAVLAYVIPLFYITVGSFVSIPSILGFIFTFSPFIIYFLERQSEFVRFHAVQSVLLNIALPLLFELGVLLISALGLHHIQIIGIILSFIYLALVLGIITRSVYSAIKAYFFYITTVPLSSKAAYYLAKDSK